MTKPPIPLSSSMYMSGGSAALCGMALGIEAGIAGVEVAGIGAGVETVTGAGIETGADGAGVGVGPCRASTHKSIPLGSPGGSKHGI